MSLLLSLFSGIGTKAIMYSAAVLAFVLFLARVRRAGARAERAAATAATLNRIRRDLKTKGAIEDEITRTGITSPRASIDRLRNEFSRD